MTSSSTSSASSSTESTFGLRWRVNNRSSYFTDTLNLNKLSCYIVSMILIGLIFFFAWIFTVSYITEVVSIQCNSCQGCNISIPLLDCRNSSLKFGELCCRYERGVYRSECNAVVDNRICIKMMTYLSDDDKNMRQTETSSILLYIFISYCVVLVCAPFVLYAVLKWRWKRRSSVRESPPSSSC